MRRWGILLIPVAALLVIAVATPIAGWRALWATPDQYGAWLLAQNRNGAAANVFLDPVWRGVALMRAKRFQEAADSFAQSDAPEAAYDRGNALVMLGQYPDAVAQYDKALKARPGWADAIANRKLAQTRADRFANAQGEEADEAHAPTDEAYNPNRKRDGSNSLDQSAETGMSEEATRSLWLLQVQTKPADFLRSRFSYQLDHASPDAAP